MPRPANKPSNESADQVQRATEADKLLSQAIRALTDLATTGDNLALHALHVLNGRAAEHVPINDAVAMGEVQRLFAAGMRRGIYGRVARRHAKTPAAQRALERRLWRKHKKILDTMGWENPI
jgi:hypothetical protein